MYILEILLHCFRKGPVFGLWGINVESGNLLKSNKEIKGYAKADVKNDEMIVKCVCQTE